MFKSVRFENFKALEDYTVHLRRVAHGRSLSYDLAKAVSANHFLREFSMKVDQKIVDSFLLIERYAH